MTFIPQTDPSAFYKDHADEVRACFARVLARGHFILGPEAAAFESEFASAFGYQAAIGVASGTDALVLSLRALGVARGDRVAIVAHTAVATVAAIELAGAEPVLVDIDPISFTMDPGSLERAFAAYCPIRAVVVVHLYGHPADMAAIRVVADENASVLIEDCAQAHGAMRDGRYVGAFGEAGAFRFYPTKNLGALGDGGLVVVRDAAIGQRLRADRQYGWEGGRVSEFSGMKSRLDEMQAAFLRLRLRHLGAGNARRREIATAYSGGLRATDLVLPREAIETHHVYHQYVVRHPQRDMLRAELQRRGVGTNIHYAAPVHRQPAYAGRLRLSPGELPVTEPTADSVFSLPIYPELGDVEITKVIDVVRQIL